jgi:hypothetical protein
LGKSTTAAAAAAAAFTIAIADDDADTAAAAVEFVHDIKGYRDRFLNARNQIHT